MVKREKRRTREPATVENREECLELANLAEVKEINRSGRAVPKAKKKRIEAPRRGEPEARARDWAVRVNPQGRKKVKKPVAKGIMFLEKEF
jgi:hypothetical protein